MTEQLIVRNITFLILLVYKFVLLILEWIRQWVLLLLHFLHSHQISPWQLKDIVSLKSTNCEKFFLSWKSGFLVTKYTNHLTFHSPNNPHNCKVCEVMVKSLNSLCQYPHFNLDEPQPLLLPKLHCWIADLWTELKLTTPPKS